MLLLIRFKISLSVLNANVVLTFYGNPTDHAGIATQVVVERQLAKKTTHVKI